MDIGFTISNYVATLSVYIYYENIINILQIFYIKYY